jgi:hypothetical protein
MSPWNKPLTMLRPRFVLIRNGQGGLDREGTMRKAILGAAFLTLTAGQASAATVQLDYDIFIAGFTMGQAKMTANFDGNRYRTELSAQLTGLAGLLTGGQGAGSASGFVGGGRPVPTAFTVNSRSSNDRRTIRMDLSGGSVSSVQIEPPLDNRPDRIPVTAAHKRGVVDPLSALLMPALSRDPVSASNCNRTIPIFDGGARFDINLSYGETRTVDKPGYKGPAIVCNARYDAIAGHRERRTVKMMEENRDMSVWLAPVPGARVLVPVRIAVRSSTGNVVIELARWTQQGGGSTAAAVDVDPSQELASSER